jgi:succinate-acetate transporter protein
MTEAARVFLRPLASPMSLGFLGLGCATVMLCGQQLSWFAPADLVYVSWAFILFAFPVQFLSAVVGFLARDGVAATGMGILSVTWLSTGVITLSLPPGATSQALGVLLVFAAGALTVPATASCLGKLVPALVLFTAAARFLVSGLYELTASSQVKTISGYLGLALLALVWYAALALELEDIRRRTVLPVLRVGAGRAAIRGDWSDQFAGVEHEAGVREQL